VDDSRQRVLDFRLRVDPATPVQSYRDYWGTRVEAFGVIPRHDRLEVVAEISVETHEPTEEPAPPTPVAELAEHEPFHEYMVPSRYTRGAGLAELGAEVVNGASTGEEVGRTVAGWVGRSLTYTPGATKVDTSIDEVVERRVGVCQDYSHLTVALCRAVGVPARYVSGYLFARRDDAGAGDADGDGEADVVRVQTHAWVEVAVAPGRWLPLDPTNGRDVGERHVKIGHGRDYFDVTPFHGSFSGSADPTLVSAVDIRRRTDADDRPTILSAADRGLLRRPVPHVATRVADQDQQDQQQQQQQ
jgi:transglutaminase-like putative cysteine protease